MAESVGAAAGGHPNLNLTPEEKRVYGQLFKEADPDGFGAVSGDVAVKFFEKTKLPPDVLGQIWQIADNENRGFLTPSGFGVVLRLIGHAQAGRAPAASLSAQPAPLPQFEGMKQTAPATAPIPAQTTGTPSSPTQAGPPPIRVPALLPEKVTEYSALFEKSGAENGMLYGGTAKQIFERARLPNEVLGKIWSLADTQSRGQLDVIEFVIAMHLLASYKSGAMRGVPNSLPPGLYEAAARRPPPRMGGPARPGSASGFPNPAIFPQTTGYQRPQSPVTRQQAGTPLSVQSTGDWAITPADKASFDAIFATIDKQGLGYLDGEQAVGFFGNARLPEETLAQIWDLADINSEGRLDRDEFAVAMYLIRQQRGTRDGRGNLPTTLPAALVPPSRRKQQIPPSQTTAPAFENAPITQPRSAAEDLFGLDVLAPSQPVAPQVAQSTGGTDAGPFASPRSPQTAPTAGPTTTSAAASTLFKPFEPSSTFGRSLAPQAAGSPGPSQARTLPTAAAMHEDLLGDSDPASSQKLTNDSAELGNLSNQVGNLSKQMTELQGNRAQHEQEISQNTHQKRAFETRLAQLRTAYEQEVQEVRALQEQLAASRNETRRLQQDAAMIEGSHADLQTQHQQLRTALEADQRENATLKEKIRQLNAEIEQLKPQAEKLRSDARQQKGLVAINKKQLSTNENERDRMKAEINSAHNEHQEAVRELEETSRGIEASKADLESSKSEHEALRTKLQEAKAALATHRAEHEAAKTRLEASKAEFEKSQIEHNASTAELETARAAPMPVAYTNSGIRSPGVASPAASISSNPFIRRPTGEATFSPPMGSPQPVQDNQNAFDSIFGPSFGTASATAPATSFRNETTQSTAHESRTPESTKAMLAGSHGTATPQMSEPPPPPTARQLTSDALPMRTPLQRAESIGSSVQVAAPASRLSPADTPRALTPTESTPSPDNHTRSSADPFGTAAADDEQESVRQAVNRTVSSDKAGDIPGAFPSVDTPRSETPARSIDPTAVAAGTGAAIVVAGAGIAAAVTHQADQEQSEADSSAPKAATTKANNFDEYFGGPAHQRTPSEQVKDFDSAFASMKTGENPNGNAGSLNQEFPDIQEIDDDDESSTDAEETPLGFDDDFSTTNTALANPAMNASNTTDFAAMSPVPSSRAQGKEVEAPTSVPEHLQARPAYATTQSAASSLPGIDQQNSPPTYGDVVPSDNPAHFPQEYKGLLPSREDPTSPPVTAGGSSHPGLNPSGEPPAYGPEVARSQDEALLNVAHQAASSSTNQSAAFDFDSAFATVGPAQVEDDEDSDDGETAFGSNHHQAHEFDPTFDSPAQSRATTLASTTQSPATTYTSTYNAVTNGTRSTTNGASAGDSFFGFADTASSVSAPQQSTVPQVSHDWDSLFAPLSTPTVQPPSQATAAQTTSVPSNEAATTTAVPVAPTATTSTASQATSSGLKVNRPQPGRALSDGTEHDDPILKRLTSMGWSRAESLAALEQFDYNIDKAADFLTFRS